MRVQRQSNMNIAQLLLTGGRGAGAYKSNKIGNRGRRDEYVHGIITPTITYSKNNSRTIGISKSVMDAINFGYTNIHKDHGETVNSIKVNGKEYSKKSLPTVDEAWCSTIQAKDNVVHFDNEKYYKYTDKDGCLHTFSCDHDRLTQPYSDLISGRQNSKSYEITKFWNMLSQDGTYLGSYFTGDEQKQFLNDAGIKEGFFSVEAGSRKQEYFYSNGNAGVAVRKFEYDAVYDMYTNRGSALFNKYEVGSVFKIGGKKYALNEDRKLDIPYGEDIFDIQFPQMKSDV